MDDDGDYYDTSRRGRWVIVRCFGGKPRRVRVWEENEDAVWVQDEENYRRRSEGFEVLWPVGFRHNAVFQDDPDLFETAKMEELWPQLAPFGKRVREATS